MITNKKTVEVPTEQIKDIQIALSELLLVINNQSSSGKLSSTIANKKISKLSSILDDLSLSQQQ